MKRKSKSHVLPVFGVGFILSVLIYMAVLCALGFLVKNGDLRGGILFALFFVSIIPGCVFYPLFVQRKLRIKGLICGSICGVFLSVSYFLFVAVVLKFHVTPWLWLMLPVGIITGVCSGVFSANFFRS